MAGNTFGSVFRVSTFGELYGPAVGCILDGCPAGIALDEAVIQRELDRRRVGQSKSVVATA
jgi:chorismate synthase